MGTKMIQCSKCTLRFLRFEFLFILVRVWEIMVRSGAGFLNCLILHCVTGYLLRMYGGYITNQKDDSIRILVIPDVLEN